MKTGRRPENRITIGALVDIKARDNSEEES